jgi:hypothetical protein
VSLAPVRRRGWGAARAALHPRPLLWALGGVAAQGALVALPGGTGWKLLAGLVAGGGAARAIAGEDRRLAAAERLHRRGPRTADLDRAPAPSTARARRLRRLLIGGTVASVVLLVGLAAGLWWLSTSAGLRERGPVWLSWFLLPVWAGFTAVEMPRLRRTLRAFPDPVGLPRTHVTVLGFTRQGSWVTLVAGTHGLAGLLATPPDAARPAALEAELGWWLGELVPGDVLVCDGRFEAGAVVALATDERTDWTASTLSAVPWSHLLPRTGPPDDAPLGRRAAVRQGDGNGDQK